MSFADWLERNCLVDSAIEEADAGLRLRMAPLIWTLACAQIASLLAALIARANARTALAIVAATGAVACGRLLFGLRGRREPRRGVVFATLLLGWGSVALVDAAGGGSGQSAIVFAPFVFWLGALYLSRTDVVAIASMSIGALILHMGAFGFSGVRGASALAIALALFVPAVVALRIVHARALLRDAQARIDNDIDLARALDVRERERFADFVAMTDSGYFETGADMKLSFVAPELRERLGGAGGATLVELIRRRHPGANGLYEIAHAMGYELAIRGRYLIWFGRDRRAVALRVTAWPAYTADGRFRGYRGRLNEVPFEVMAARLSGRHALDQLRESA